MITDTTVRRRLTLMYFKDQCEISEGGKETRTVSPAQAEAIVALMEGYTNFFIIDSTPTRLDRKDFIPITHARKAKY